jgi:hypothetical protein
MVPGNSAERAQVIVYVPAHAQVQEGRKEPAFEVRQRPDGTRELPVFFSLERLVQALGRYQPWVALPLAALQDALGTDGLDHLAINPAATPGMWRWGPDDLEALRGQITAARGEGAAGASRPERQ